MDDIKIKPCPMCGGMPILLVIRQAMDCTVNVECSNCGLQSLGVVFAGRMATTEQRKLLPPLRSARRQVIAAWNERVTSDAGAEHTAAEAQRAGLRDDDS